MLLCIVKWCYIKYHVFLWLLESTPGKMNVYRVAKQMAKSRQDVVGVNCVKDANGKVLVENDQVKEEWRKYMTKLLNENTRDNATTCDK